LIALQAVGGSVERRRRAVRRADKILDLLDAVKVSLLEGEVPASALGDLVTAVQQTRDSTDNLGLETVLNEIETRAAVEIAKLQAR
jgi:flavin-binding protein dodecin